MFGANALNKRQQASIASAYALLDRTFKEYRGECFERTMTQVIQAEYHFNRNFALRGEACLNEFYDFLGLPHIDGGDAIGWDIAFGDEFYGYQWIDFEHESFTLEDGMECTLINYPFPPTRLTVSTEDRM